MGKFSSSFHSTLELTILQFWKYKKGNENQQFSLKKSSTVVPGSFDTNYIFFEMLKISKKIKILRTKFGEGKYWIFRDILFIKIQN
jgi:hypothetical protein